MPTYWMDQREEVHLSDEQVELARMALDDYRALMDPSTAAVMLLKREFGFSLKLAVCAVAYVRQNS